jgi:hypothetical protein
MMPINSKPVCGEHVGLQSLCRLKSLGLLANVGSIWETHIVDRMLIEGRGIH